MTRARSAKEGETRGQDHPGCLEDIQDEVTALIEFLLASIANACAVVPEQSEDAISAVFVAIIRALDLGDNSLFPRITVPTVVEAAILEAVAGNLGRDVRPMERVSPVLRLGRLGATKAGEGERQGQHLSHEKRDTIHLRVGSLFPNRRYYDT